MFIVVLTIYFHGVNFRPFQRGKIETNKLVSAIGNQCVHQELIEHNINQETGRIIN